MKCSRHCCTTTEPVAVRTLRGYEWLEEHGQFHGLDITKLDADTFDIASAEDCALGQTSPDRCYSYALDRIHGGFHNVDWAVDHGFFCGPDDYLKINDAWRTLIRARQLVAVQ